MKKIDRFSYSSLESYRKCPAQFKFRYLDRIYKIDESIEAFMGKRIHEALEFLYNEVLENKFPFFDHVIEKFKSNWHEKWHDRIGIVNEINTSDYYRLLGETCLAKYYRRYNPFDQFIVGNEIKLEFELNNDERYKIKAVIDRLDHDGNGNWEIHDYKSGKRAFTQKQADEDIQLALYQIGLSTKEQEIKSIKLIWHFLQHGIDVTSTRNQSQLEKLSLLIRRRINKIQKDVENKTEFVAKKSILCNWCYYWEECPSQFGTNPYIKS